MVLVNNRYKPQQERFPVTANWAVATTIIVVITCCCYLGSFSLTHNIDSFGHPDVRREEARLRSERVSPYRPRPSVVIATFDESMFETRAKRRRALEERVHHSCPYGSISELTEEEHHPVAGERHMVTPPQGGTLHLVCCDTTAGAMNIAVHHKWAPRGAGRFIEMVQQGYFNDDDGAVPFMRCVRGFLCQFGLHADANKRKAFHETILDDPNWLPEGPTHRQNDAGVKRFARGYLAFAGGGKNTRDKQLIMALDDNGPLGGGSPWEVPWGEVVGATSYQTLQNIYSGYGEKGPSQGKLMNKGMTDEMRKEFPLLDYITKCEVVGETIDDEPEDALHQDGAAATIAANLTAAPVTTVASPK